uniref:Uncharacterized protein n=1 Tax=Meloidogyne hapla TaxID=6305 RepID=A0A1I8BTP8_MELHA
MPQVTNQTVQDQFTQHIHGESAGSSQNHQDYNYYLNYGQHPNMSEYDLYNQALQNATGGLHTGEHGSGQGDTIHNPHDNTLEHQNKGRELIFI